jgi:hypothetical protein
MKITRGGKRPGAGRPAKRTESIAVIARRYTETAISTLAEIAMSGRSELARVSAANALLDRAYGRPQQALELTGKDGGPVEQKTTVVDEQQIKSAVAKLEDEY